MREVCRPLEQQLAVEYLVKRDAIDRGVDARDAFTAVQVIHSSEVFRRQHRCTTLQHGPKCEASGHQHHENHGGKGDNAHGVFHAAISRAELVRGVF